MKNDLYTSLYLLSQGHRHAAIFFIPVFLSWDSPLDKDRFKHDVILLPCT